MSQRIRSGRREYAHSLHALDWCEMSAHQAAQFAVINAGFLSHSPWSAHSLHALGSAPAWFAISAMTMQAQVAVAHREAFCSAAARADRCSEPFVSLGSSVTLLGLPCPRACAALCCRCDMDVLGIVRVLTADAL